ncbi:hypothetical protein C0992_006240 [Termitomyces sp. T32_za158]|nr:hypothetical protein C0992_006240 [Termitomyces sp. T32_za158]
MPNFAICWYRVRMKWFWTTTNIVTNVGPIMTPNAAGTQLVLSPVTAATPSKGLALFLVGSPTNVARAFVLEQRKLSLARKAILISAASLTLPTAQESGVVVDVVDLAPTTSKASRKVAKAIPRREETPPVVGPSQQIIPVDLVELVLCPGGVVLSDPELPRPSGAEVQSDHEEAAESSDSLESSSEVLAVPRHAVQPNYVPLPTPCVNGQEFIWLRKALDYPISTLRPAKYIEVAKEKAEGMTTVLRKDMQAAVLEMEGL